MVVEIRTSQDLLNLLDNNEEFRRAARRALLTDDLLELPDLVREMQQTQRLMIQQMAQLAERMDQMEERQSRMEERQGRMEERQDRMEELLARVVAQQELTVERLDRMDARMDKMDARFEQMDARFGQIIAEMSSMNRRIGDIDGRVRGWELERESVAKLMPRLAREYGVVRIRAVGADLHRSAVNLNYVWAVRFEEALEAAHNAGRITSEEEDIIGRTDIVAWGRRRVDDARQWFAVQASATIGNDDIERAATGAEALRKLNGEDAVGVVYGRRIAAQQRVRAEDLGVAVVLDEDGGQE